MKYRTRRRMRKAVGWQAGVLAIAGLVLILLVGQFLGIWTVLARGLLGTAGPGNGYTCLPTCQVDDGKWLVVPGEELATFASSKIVAWISVPATSSSFSLDFFDGDAGKDADGAVNWKEGNWDTTPVETVYTLYADPLKDGTGREQVKQWYSTGNLTPNNDWYVTALDTDARALDPAGDLYVYRLECVRSGQGGGDNAFKVRSSGYLSTGQADLVNTSLALMGGYSTFNDVPLLIDDPQTSSSLVGTSRYDGEWSFSLLLPNSTETLELWDGDFDRVTSTGLDTDDPNTEETPPWAGYDAGAEGESGRGGVTDDAAATYFRVPPGVWYEIVDPQGTPYTNGEPGSPNEPSGNREWERFSISTNPDGGADVQAEQLGAGQYTWAIHGLDHHNLTWIRTNLEICPFGQCPPLPAARTCPRTTGYWKNEVGRVLIDGLTEGTQETRAGLDRALDLVAMSSPLYRSGISLAYPQPIDAPAAGNPPRLTDVEANAVLNMAGGDTPLDRAVQQNLAAWLNLMSGKLNKTTFVTLDWGSGSFEGTVWQALQAAQSAILNATGTSDPALVRAKNIAAQINNGLLGDDAETSTCEDYLAVMPADRQPPDSLLMPKGPAPAAVPAPVVGCQNPRRNQYGVEGMVTEPFDGIQFDYWAGTAVKDGAGDEFQLVLPAQTVTGMTAVQMAARAGQIMGQATLDGCQFDAFAPCDLTASDASGLFEFAFMGARDNRDGTLTLVFWVKNPTASDLSRVTIGLPDGQVPLWPTGSYTSQVCQ